MTLPLGIAIKDLPYDPTPATDASIAIQDAAGGPGSTKRTTVADLGTGGGALSTATHVVTTAELAASFSAPVEIVPAPGVGFALIGAQFTFETIAGVGAFAANHGGAGVFYGEPIVPPDPSPRWEAGALASNLLTDISAIAGVVSPVDDLAVSPSLAVVTSGATTGAPMIVPTYLARATVENQPLVFASVSEDPTPAGPILTGLTHATIDVGGTGYAVNDTGTIDQDRWGGGATYRVTAVTGSVVTAVTVVAGGDGYTIQDNPLATGVTTGGGDGNLTLNVVTLNAAAMTTSMAVTVLYWTLALH